MIELREVVRRFERPDGGHTTALHGVDLTVRAGEIVTIIGSNGSGKSTLLGIIAGDVRPTSGHVELDGQDVCRIPPHRRARLVSRVFQDPLRGTASGLSLAENLRMAETRGMRRFLRPAIRRDSRERYRALLAPLELGLEREVDALAGTLSGGQRQAMTLVMAGLASPRVLLLDEPTAALDPAAAKTVMHLVERVSGETGAATIMVCHSMALALATGDRLVAMHRGRIEREWSSEERKGLRPEDLAACIGGFYARD